MWSTISEIIEKTKHKPSGIKSVVSEGNLYQTLSILLSNSTKFCIRTIVNKMKQPEGINHIKTPSHHLNLNSRMRKNNAYCAFLRKSSSEKYGISLKISKYLVPGLSRSLTLIINQPLLRGIFSDRLNIAKVIPLHKEEISQYKTTKGRYVFYQQSRKYLEKNCTRTAHRLFHNT